MAFTESWIETDPDGSVITGSQLDDYQRQTKRALRERMEGDPAAPLTGIYEIGSFTAAPTPRAGSARVYVGTDATIQATAAGSRQDGRLGFATDTKRLYHVGAAAVVEVGYMSTTGPNTQTQASSRNASFMVRDSAATALAANALFAANGTQVVTQSHNSNARFAAVSFAGPSQFIGYRGNGDSGATTQVVNGSTLASFQGRGYTNAPAWTTSGAGGLEVIATEGWTAGANGAKVIIFVTATGGTATTIVMTANADGTATFNSTVNATTFVGALTGNATTATTATSATTAGTVTTAAQPAITSVGTLTSLAVSGAFSSGAATVTTLAGTGAVSGFTTASFSSTGANTLVLNRGDAAGVNGLIELRRAGVAKAYVGLDASDNFTVFDTGPTARITMSSALLTLASTTTAVQALTATQVTGTGVIRNDALATGWAMGAVAGVQRISWDGTAFNFVNPANANAPIIASAGTFNSGGISVAGGLTVSSGTTAVQALTATQVTLGNGQFYRTTRNTGGLILNLIGTESGSDRVLVTSSGDFVIQDGSANANLTLTTAGLGTFRGGISCTTGTFSAGAAVAATQKFYLDGVAMSGDSYIYESSANVVDHFVGGAQAMRLTATQATFAGAIKTADLVVVSRAATGWRISDYAAAVPGATTGNISIEDGTHFYLIPVTKIV